MEKVIFILPTVREHLFKRCISSMGEIKYPIQVLAQKYHPEYPHEYLDDYLGTSKAVERTIEMAPPSEYFFLIDDDFIFRDGWEESIEFGIHSLDNNRELGCLIFSDSNTTRSQSTGIDTQLCKNRVHKLTPEEILAARKESGILIRNHLLRETFQHTQNGEDFAKIVHCYLDGYDVGLIKANITHAHEHDGALSWKNLSKQLFSSFAKHKFYYSLLKEEGVVDGEGFTEAGIKIHEYNRKRRLNKRILNKRMMSI